MPLDGELTAKRHADIRFEPVPGSHNRFVAFFGEAPMACIGQGERCFIFYSFDHIFRLVPSGGANPDDMRASGLPEPWRLRQKVLAHQEIETVRRGDGFLHDLLARLLCPGAYKAWTNIQLNPL